MRMVAHQVNDPVGGMAGSGLTVELCGNANITKAIGAMYEDRRRMVCNLQRRLGATVNRHIDAESS